MKYRCLGCVIISLVVCMRYNQPSIWAPHTTSILLFSILLIPHRPLLLFNKLPHRNKQTNKQSINQLQQPMSHPQKDNPTITKIFFSPWVDLLASTQLPQHKNSSTISHRIPIPQPASRGSQNMLWPRLGWWRLQTSHYLGAEAYYARRRNSREARRNSWHLHLHEVVMWGRIMLLHVAVWGGIVGQPNFISSITLCCCHNNHNT
jgi:hypothetical protein